MEAAGSGTARTQHMKRPTILWVGDAGVSSGFARATHETLKAFVGRYDIHVLGINYPGDPHKYPYPIYPAFPGGDYFGVGRLRGLSEIIKPDIIVIQQDTWNIPAYLKEMEGLKIPIVGAIAVDGKNCEGFKLNDLAFVVFWTHFAQAEARKGGFDGQSTVIPLGVDLKTYYPTAKQGEKSHILGGVLQIAQMPENSYVVGVVGRNQPRKRFDLTMEYFSEWIYSHDVRDACLWVHCAPTMESAYVLKDLAQYYGLSGRAFSPSITPVYGLTETAMNRIYNMMDVFFSTTQGEGMGLPALEAMATRTPCVLPDWSGYGDWAKDGAVMVPCKYTAVTPNIHSTVIGGIADKAATVEALHRLYSDRDFYHEQASRGFDLVNRPEFRWENIGHEFLQVCEHVLGIGTTTNVSEDAWKDMGRPAEALT